MFEYRRKWGALVSARGRHGQPWFTTKAFAAVAAGLTGAAGLAVGLMAPQVGVASQGTVAGKGATPSAGPTPGGRPAAGSAQAPPRSVRCDANDLIAAIIDANAHGGATLDLARRCDYTLTANRDGNGLPFITSPIDIHGNDATIVRAANAADFRIFDVLFGGVLNLRDLSLKGGKDSSGFGGGAILVQSGGLVTLSHTSVTGNTTRTNGGAIANRGGLGVTDTTFADNSANGDNSNGGAIDSRGGRLMIETTRMEYNYARLSGGALYSDDANVTISRTSINGNNADSGAGAFLGGDSTLTEATVADNHADSSGGGIRVGVGAPVILRKTDIRRNTAAFFGGGAFNSGSLVIEDGKVTGNGVRSAGGGIHNEFALLLRRTDVTGNQAYGLGGKAAGIDSSNGNISLVDSRVTENNATLEPGGVSARNGTVVLDAGSVVVNNRPTNCRGSELDIPNCFG